MISMVDLQELSVNHLENFICFKFEGSCDSAVGSLKKERSEGKLYMGDVFCCRTFDLNGLSHAAVKVVKELRRFPAL